MVNLIDTQYLTIGQASRRLRVSTSTLKAWEAVGLIPRLKRIHLNRIRVFTEDDIKEIEQFIRENYASHYV